MTSLVGCATLPSVRLSRELPISRTPVTFDMEGPTGPIEPEVAIKTSEALAEYSAGTVLDGYLGLSHRSIREPLIIGNHVELLIDGPETYAAMFKSLKAASRTIDLESYIFDEVEQDGMRLSALLEERVRAGVQVRVLVDGVGTMGSTISLDAWSAAGIATCGFNPVAPSLWRPTRLNHRDHRKIVVVDGQDAFAGGINFSRVYSLGSAGFSRSRPAEDLPERQADALNAGWRDTQVRIEGPAARRLAELFEESWKKQDCKNPAAEVRPVPEGRQDTATVAKAGDTVVQVIPSSPDSAQNLTYISVLGAIAFAKSSIEVTMAYFVPDEQLEDELIAAAGRGVNVRLILPSFSDFDGVFYAGRYHYARLLKGGVQIFEERSAFLHAKTVVVDHIWSTVGSTNWDWRSFGLNDEVSIVVIDENFANRMRQLFESDLQNSVPITWEEWQERSLGERIKERFWATFERLL
ncbi:MAG: phospholipase D-like domain-containing protein [Gammaproteobacteria bacterium]